MTPSVVHSVAKLGPEWNPLFAASPDLQSSREWFAAIEAAALPPGARPHYLGVVAADGPIALFPVLDPSDGTLQSLTTPYTCLYQPLLRPGAVAASLPAAMTAFAAFCRRWPVTRLEALDPDWAGLSALRAAFARFPSATRDFAHFVNWHATIPAGSWEAYLQSRPGALRETIRRKLRAAERNATLRFEVARAGADLMRCLEAYEHVYAKSWKQPEPFPTFSATLVRELADTNGLRMFLLWQGEQAIAAQYWTVMHGTATVLKLAHDEAFKTLSPGTILTAFAIRHLIDTDGISNLDFGRGDDPYKRAWTGESRIRIGVLGLNLATMRGVGVLARHDIGRLRRVFQPKDGTPSTAC